MAGLLAVIYSPQLGIEPPEGTVQRRFQPPSVGATQAVNDFEAAMSYCRDEVLPELDGIDRDVIRPTIELQTIIKTIQKTMVKRDHKLLDYDRHRTSLGKLHGKNAKSFSEEKQVIKLESQLAAATADYEYLNNLLKTQLGQFFHLKSKFIDPVVERFYELQCKIYGMIYARHYEMMTANTQHFGTSSMPILDGFNWRQAQHNMRAEYESLDLLKAGGKAWLAVSGGSTNSKLSLQERASLKQMERQSVSSAGDNAVTPAKNNQQLDVSAGPLDDSPPMQPPSPVLHYQSTATTHVIALYDYEAQAQGDLSFQKDDLIQVISRTSNANDWWTGHLRGTTGIFPGNYVADI
ncbi:hypothetical protein CLU79DRAFT_802338 [Phycomyces nitens]|nr:hypothetical protein CLU79DRAFT_802338 [Phycomyces nitens]